MALNFKKIAEDKGIIRGGILAGRNFARLQSIVGEVVTITGVQPNTGSMDGKTSRYPAIVLKEYPNNYFSGGPAAVAHLISSWADEAGCPVDDDAVRAGYSCVHKNYDALTDEIVKQGGIPITFKMTHSQKSGRDYVDFNLI